MDSLLSNSSNITNSTANSTQLVPTRTPSEPEISQNDSLKWVYVVFYGIICLIGTCGNLMVILASRKPGMITVSNIFIANLAVADFTVSLVNIPTVVTYSFLVYWPFGAFLCKLIPFLQGLTLAASVGTLVAIAGERYYHIVFYTKRQLTIRKAYKVIVVIWVISVFIPLPLTLFSKIATWKLGDKDVPVCIEEWPNVKSKQAFTTLLFFLLYFIPLLLICVLYLKISLFLKSFPDRGMVNNRAQRKAVRMMVTVTLLFAFSWLPYHILFMYLDLSQAELTSPLTSFILFVQWLMFANSACNPLVYAVLNDNYKRVFAAMVFRRQLTLRNSSIRVQTVPRGV